MKNATAVRWFVALIAIVVWLEAPPASGDGLLTLGPWKQNGFATQRFQIRGTGSRNNPLRTPLRDSYDGDELFVRFRMRYDASTIDTPQQEAGEFFVLWLDRDGGHDTSTHSNGVPNVGIHVADDGNRFMVRFGSSRQRFAELLVGDRDYLVVARLWKSVAGSDASFDQLSLWVNPLPSEEFKPNVSVQHTNTISEVRWIGFSTGAKTELEDCIEVWDINVAPSWRQILELPPEAESDAMTRPLAAPTVNFGRDVYPILKSRCFSCHQGDDAKEGVRLDVWDEVLNQTNPRDASSSRLIELVTQGEMPPEDHLTAAEIRILRTWVDEGVEWDEGLLPTPKPVTDHWAFQPIVRPAIPQINDDDWIRNPVDAFVARKHIEAGLTPAPTATSEVLRRRMSLDLLGLPPGVHEVSVDYLLSDPAYGERRARHWLDVARWAESNGHQHNRMRPHAWRYRDWVIGAFNEDPGFDDFIRRQIAGDELEPYRREHLIATGFLAAARYSGNELDKRIQRNDLLVDIVNTTSQAFLGLTMECAQCHSHKFDPISIRDYYRFQAFFQRGQPGNLVLDPSPDARALVEQRWRLFDSVHARLVRVKRKLGHPEPIYVTPKSVVAGMRPDEKQTFAKLEQQIESLSQTWGYYSPASSPHELAVAPHDMRWPLPRGNDRLRILPTNLLIRGEVSAPGPAVDASWPSVFGAADSVSSPTRTSLADWLLERTNPLTARVWVNRLWQWHFGRGLVETSGDFGTQGAAPTHPELLDYLACELIDSGWSTKRVERLILNSATYRQSSTYSARNDAIDPENRLLWRWRPRRLESEAIRDSILFVAGDLNLRVGGESEQAGARRRAIYLRQRRDNLPNQQVLFDGANGIVSCSRRRTSTSPLQPLWLLNNELTQRAARAFADRAGSVEAAVRMAYGRDGADEELSALRRLEQTHGLESACLAIFGSSEFAYVP